MQHSKSSFFSRPGTPDPYVFTRTGTPDPCVFSWLCTPTEYVFSRPGSPLPDADTSLTFAFESFDLAPAPVLTPVMPCVCPSTPTAPRAVTVPPNIKREYSEARRASHSLFRAELDHVGTKLSL